METVMAISTINERLAELQAHYQLNTTDFAIKCGISQQVMDNILKGNNKPGTKTLTSIITNLGVNYEWLINGNGPMFKTDIDKLLEDSGSRIFGKITDLEHVPIALLDAKAIGSFTGNIYGNMTHLTTGRHFLALKMPGVDYENVFALRVEGNSMAPRYPDGTFVLVRPVSEGRWQYARGVNAISIKSSDSDNGMFTIKRVIQSDDKKLILKADNPNEPNQFTVQLADVLCMFKVTRILDSPEED